MPVLFRRIRGRAAGHVVAINALLVRSIEPTSWGGAEIAFSDMHVVVSRDNPLVVQQLLEGRVRLCQTPLCDRDTVDPYTPLCARCRDHAPKVDERYEAAVADLVIVGGKHGFA